MNRNALLCLGLLAAVLVSGCGKQDEVARAAPASVPQVAPAPAPQAVGESCSKDCGGMTVAITCAEGETPVCECGPPPAASCRVPKP